MRSALHSLNNLLLFLAFYLILIGLTANAQQPSALETDLQVHRTRLETEIATLKSQYRAISLTQKVLPWAHLGKRRPTEVRAELQAQLRSKELALQEVDRLLAHQHNHAAEIKTYATLVMDERQKAAQMNLINSYYEKLSQSNAYSMDDLFLDDPWMKNPPALRKEQILSHLNNIMFNELQNESIKYAALPAVPSALQAQPQECHADAKQALTTHAGPLPAAVDLRFRLPPVRNQGNVGACAVFATLAGIEALPGIPSDLSEKLLYCRVLATRQGKSENLLDCGADYRWIFSILKTEPLCEEKECTWDGTLNLPDDLQTGGKRIVLEQFAYYSPEELDNNPQILESLLANGYFPIIGIYAARTFLEDWEHLDTPLLNEPHALLLAGYGNEISPFSGRREDYFWLRDSSAPGMEVEGRTVYFHRKVSRQELRRYLKKQDGIYTILAASAIAPK